MYAVEIVNTECGLARINLLTYRFRFAGIVTKFTMKTYPLGKVCFSLNEVPNKLGLNVLNANAFRCGVGIVFTDTQMQTRLPTLSMPSLKVQKTQRRQ
jgi:hypothetical protein